LGKDEVRRPYFESMICAIYARVSTLDKGQDTENQLVELRRYAATQNWETLEYIDHESGKTASRKERRAWKG
jgi:DNA invertase Pin-like site-specific DNA recombinase